MLDRENSSLSFASHEFKSSQRRNPPENSPSEKCEYAWPESNVKLQHLYRVGIQSPNALLVLNESTERELHRRDVLEPPECYGDLTAHLEVAGEDLKPKANNRVEGYDHLQVVEHGPDKHAQSRADVSVQGQNEVEGEEGAYIVVEPNDPLHYERYEHWEDEQQHYVN